MFYSHDILTSRQYGVATIWCVATIGRRGVTKGISRKAIKAVQIKKACEKIIDPGAPLALRLQSNLLYGVSRVYSEQCRYVLDDAVKMRSAMAALDIQIGAMNATDPKAGKAPRGQNIIPDDPHFNIDNITMPEIDLTGFDDLGDFLRTHGSGSQGSSMMFSQLSPLDGSFGSLSSDSLRFDFLQSGQSSQQLPTPLKGPGSAGPKSLVGTGGVPFSDDDALLPVEGGFGFEVDAEGNLIELGELELPPLPGPDSQIPGIAELEEMQIRFEEPEPRAQATKVPTDLDAMMVEEPLPDAEAFQTQEQREKEQQAAKASSPRKSAAPRGPRRRLPSARAFIDVAPPQIDDAEYKSTGSTYVERAEAEAYRTQETHAVRAKKNAFLVTFGTGIADVGRDLGVVGIQHPLAEFFAGDALRNTALGVPSIEHLRSPESENGRRRRRSASEAFSEEGEEQGRRVKQKTDTYQEQPLGDEIQLPIEGDDILSEVGRRAQSLAEPRSSSGVPWSRQGSVPGSAVKSITGTGRRSRQVSASPLVGRGSVLPDIERFSDPHFPSDDFFPGHHDNSYAHSGCDSSSFGEFASMNESQMQRAVDQAGQDFLAYVVERAKVSGRADEAKDGRKWVDFDELADPATHGREVAAQAFYHALVLATRREVAVRQEGLPWKPFGRIEIGVDVVEVEAEAEDEGVERVVEVTEEEKAGEEGDDI